MDMETTPVQEAIARQPVSDVRWLNRELLHPNDYNPNRVAPPELELLILSILEDGWTQPIVILPDCTIVDGFHRYTVSADPRLMARFAGMVPTVTVDVDPVHRRMSTIRHNRARGTHGILPMGEIVADILAAGVEEGDVMRRLGMEREEIKRLTIQTPVTVLGAGKDQEGRPAFGKAWKPNMDRSRAALDEGEAAK